MRGSPATVVGEIAEERIHGFVPGRVDHGATVAPDRDKARHAQAVKMERQGIRREVERVGDFPRWHPLRPGLHEEPENVEAIILGERRQGGYGI